MDQSDGTGSPGSSKRKIFHVEPETLELAIGETSEVRVWAFPTEVRVYRDTLIACLTDNPRPVLFPVSCSGAIPLMVLEGPWDKLLSAEQAALAELGCTEVRGVEPVRWCVCRRLFPSEPASFRYPKRPWLRSREAGY